MHAGLLIPARIVNHIATDLGTQIRFSKTVKRSSVRAYNRMRTWGGFKRTHRLIRLCGAGGRVLTLFPHNTLAVTMAMRLRGYLEVKSSG